MGPRSEPEFYRTVRRKSGRSYGPCDFEEFDRYSACSGHGRLGKVDISCRFRFEESEWGLMGSRRPGCIIYMDVSFGVQCEHILQTATVLVTLESLEQAQAEEQAALDRLSKQRMFPLSVANAQFTHFGPHKIDGRETETDVSSMIHLTPSIEAGGFGVGGMGWSRSKNQKHHNRWEFSGQLVGEDDHTSFRTLQWILKENSLDSPSNHPNEFHTAFALIHSGASFFIRVQVQGKLIGFRDGFKHKLQRLKFGVSGSKSKQSTLTLVSLDGVDLPTKQLLPKAKNLRQKLAKKNGVIQEEADTGPRDHGASIPHRAPQPEEQPPHKPRGFPNGPSIAELAKVHASLGKSSTASLPTNETRASSTTAGYKDHPDTDSSLSDSTKSSSLYSSPTKHDPATTEKLQTPSQRKDARKHLQEREQTEWRYIDWQVFGMPFFLLWARLFIPLFARLAQQIEDSDRQDENASEMASVEELTLKEKKQRFSR
ncbi:hypothetical protein QBC34DRAFT_403328 [Podospora aff. communis PSN243]|uniref:Uncharacterized protein n=1 Tax=Podospora aff. communis PSN243 TaxID=3040156 RepID=A0AAV9GQ61_9PEZI|nr:hypothetical protein QBC34DRAFT_403328 [Podospora aff. communis PSN243]